MSLGALAAKEAVTVAGSIDNTNEQGFKVLRTEWFIGIYQMKEDERILVGLCHDLTKEEVAEAINATPKRAGDPGESEKAMRPIWPLANFAGGLSSTATDHFQDKGVAKLGWSFPEGTQLKWFAYNHDNSAALIGGIEVFVIAKHFGVWLRD